MLRKIRIGVAAVFFLCITLLFLDFTGTVHAYVGWMAKVQFLPALLALNVGVVIILVLVTLLFGRVYCSTICPLGIMQDMIAWLSHKRKRHRYQYSPAKSWLRYPVLVAFVVALVSGFTSLAALLAPYSSYGRMAQNLLSPLWGWANNALAYMAERADSYAFYETDVWLRSIAGLTVASVTLVIVAVLAWRGGRTYCNTLCPVGTVLGLISRFAWFRPTIDINRCVGCKLCAKDCKASCIDAAHHQIDYSRCVGCMDCLDKCHVDAIRYVHPKRKKTHTSASKGTDQPTASNDAAEPSRRTFLTAATLVTTTALLEAQQKKTDGGLAAIADKHIPKRNTPIVPAGASSQKHFYQHCTACQLCVSVCPNGVLRPSTDLTRLMQPVMSYERGYCRPECTRCSEVCPAGAIRLIDRATKSATHIGHAVWYKKNCIPLTDGVECGNCARHCPAGAITMIPIDSTNPKSLHRPVIDAERCIGCGACENLCPSRPLSAIIVEGHEVHSVH